MNDVYLEYILKKKKNGMEVFINACIIFAAIIATIFIFILMMATASYGQLLSTIILLLGAGVWYFSVNLINKQSIEYEYILTNSEIDIDKIMSKKARKRLASFDFKQVAICANVKDELHNFDYKNKNVSKVINVVGDDERGNIYFADYDCDGEQRRVVFQPTMKMLETVKKYNPRCIFVMED